MKALKLSFTAVLLAVMAFSYAGNEPKAQVEKSGYIKISLEDAKSSRSFAQDIYNQVDISILYYGGVQKSLIYAKVRHGRGVYLVFGKFAEWEDFFLREGGNNGGGIIGPPIKKSELIMRTE
jgi:hypothetical protein